MSSSFDNFGKYQLKRDCDIFVNGIKKKKMYNHIQKHISLKQNSKNYFKLKFCQTYFQNNHSIDFDIIDTLKNVKYQT